MDIFIIKLMALAVLVLPLFALPFIMKAAGGILERFGVWANNRQKGLIDRPRNWARDNSKRANATQRARLASTEVGKRWGTSQGRRWGYNEDGTEKAGRLAQLQRTLGRGASGLGTATRETSHFAGGYQARRDARHNWQEEHAKRIQNEEIYKRLGEIDETTGRATASAERFAARAAGAGGLKNAERIMQLSREAQTNEFVAERKRSINDLDNSGLYAPGSRYSVWSDDKNDWVDIGADTGGGAHALSLGKRVRITNAAGAMREFSGRDSGGMIGKAAIEMATAASDGSAITRMQGLKDNMDYLDAADVERIKKYGAGVATEFGDSLNQSMGSNASKNAQKFQSLYAGTDALNGAGDETVAQWHGGQWLIAGHQINYLRAKAQEKMAAATTEAELKAAEAKLDEANLFADKIKEEFRQVRDGESRMSGLYSKGKEEAFQAFATLVDDYTTTGSRAEQYDHLFTGGGVGPKKDDYTTAA